MNLKSLFLIVSCVAFSNIHCSYQDQQASKASLSPSNSDQTRTKVTEYLTPPQASNSQSAPSTQPAQSAPSAQPAQPTPSTMFTAIWYGASKHIAGKTALAIFMELNEDGKLKADYKSHTSEAMNRFNEAAEERFTKKDLLTPSKQKKITELFKTATEINHEFVLAKALADRYYILQKEALEATLKKQANAIEPQLRKKRNDIILQAEQEYIVNLNKELWHGKDAASNSRYLYKRAEIQDEFSSQTETHYENIESFSKLLHQINPNVEIANETNLHHLPKAAYKTN